MELRLLTTIQGIEAQQGAFARDLIAPLRDLGLLYIDAGDCLEAIAALYQAVDVSRRLDGLFNPEQVELLEPMMECLIALELQFHFERTQHYVLLLNEGAYGKNDPALVPALQQAARRYEKASQYLSARELYERAIRILSNASGADDLRLVEPLRGVARTYRLEYLFPPDKDVPLNYRGERTLKRAVEILRVHPEADRRRRFVTFLDLGDWYQMVGKQGDARRAYQEAWREISGPDDPQAEAFSVPTSIRWHPDIDVVLREPLPPKEPYQRHFIELDFTVTRTGRITDVRVTDSDAPDHVQYRFVDDFLRTPYRPRFVDGEPVDTAGLHARRTFRVSRR